MDIEASKQPRKSRDYPHSISAANTFRRCPRLYYNSYILGWMEASEASWLKFGTKIDNLLEIIDTSNLQMALEAIPTMFEDIYDQMDVEVLLTLFCQEFGHEILPPVDLYGQPGNQHAFYINYQGNPVTGLISMTVSGKIDKVTIIDGEIGVMEGKTTTQPINANSPYWKKLDLDPQIACYVWGLSKELGKPVNWVWYQVIRRPNATAHPLFNKTYTKNRVTCTYTPDEYRTRVFSLLKQKQDPAKILMARKKLYITEERKTLWVTEHAQSWQDIQLKKEAQASLVFQGLPPELAWPRNHLGCDMYGGCPYVESCTGKQTIEDSNRFTKRINK